MNVEIRAKATLFPEKEYINRIAVAVWGFLLHGLYKKGDYFTPPVSGRSIAEVGLNNIFYPLILCREGFIFLPCNN